MGEPFGQPPIGVHDRRVIASPQPAADVGIAEAGEPAGEVHGDVASFNQRGPPSRAGDGSLGEAVKSGRDGDDLFELGEVVATVI